MLGEERGGADVPLLDKQQILDEIKRTAEANSGNALGQGRFQKETGIKRTDWYSKYWIRWGDALQEAGYPPKSFLQESYDETYLIEKLIVFVREIKHFPVAGELVMKAREDKTFPSYQPFHKLGGKAGLVSKVVEYCKRHSGYDDIIKICESLKSIKSDANELVNSEKEEFGYIYLIKSGRYYKIGRSNSVGRREYELAIQLPEKATTVHTISTDDPVGIEAYWHKRFELKRKNGEWFELASEDIKAFKRRKFM
jgi:Meiotically up-regulated gene 113